MGQVYDEIYKLRIEICFRSSPLFSAFNRSISLCKFVKVSACCVRRYSSLFSMLSSLWVCSSPCPREGAETILPEKFDNSFDLSSEISSISSLIDFMGCKRSRMMGRLCFLLPKEFLDQEGRFWRGGRLAGWVGAFDMVWSECIAAKISASLEALGLANS